MTGNAWEDVARIYKEGIATKNATFQTEAPNWESFDHSHRQDCRLLASIDGYIVGWAALSHVSARAVYAGVAEVSIYVDSTYRGKGIGDRLMEALIRESELNGVWTLQAGIFPENIGSIKLHQKHGFRILGTRERVGKMDHAWRDVTIMERRSTVVGVD